MVPGRLGVVAARGHRMPAGITDVEVTPALRVFKQAQALMSADRLTPVAVPTGR